MYIIKLNTIAIIHLMGGGSATPLARLLNFNFYTAFIYNTSDRLINKLKIKI